MEQNRQFYENFFDKFDVDVHDNPARFSAVARFLNGSVLDVACGTGTLSKYYTGDYVGIDWADSAIQKAVAVRRKDARFMVADVTKEKLAFPKQFNCAYLGEFLEHVSDDQAVFDNVLRNLVPNGRIVVSVPNAHRVPDESHCRTFTVPQIRREYSKYGKVRFHNFDGFQFRILFSIEVGCFEPDQLSLVMIVKNEVKGIEKAIISALPLVDRVVVSVDSKTQDQTAKIAALYADELKQHEWQDNFSTARNFAQENVKTPWILFLDGHEYIESYGDAMEKIKCDVEGVFVTVRMESGMTFLYPRIYRNTLKFKNAVHNLIECTTRRVAKDFVIVHDRINGQEAKSAEIRNAQRATMLPAELKNQLKKDPTNPRAHFHLANFYMMRHEVKLAMYHYKQVIKYGKSPDEKYLTLLHYGALHAAKGHSFRALWSFNKADKLIPGRWETARTIGGFYFMQGWYKKAVEYLVDALGQNTRRYAYEPMTQNKAEIWDLIGHCFNKMNQNAKAVIAWQQAQKNATDQKQKDFFAEKVKFAKMLLPNPSPQRSESV